MNPKHTLSPRGLELLKQLEGFSAAVYRCPAGRPTVGYDHVISARERFLRPITQAEGEVLLRGDLEPAENYINITAAGKGSLNGGYRLTQNRFDALVLLVFNIGVTRFSLSTLLKCLQSGDMVGAAEQFLAWNKITVNGKKQVCEGLVKRRTAERALFLSITTTGD